MCGICGLATRSPDERVDRKMLARMTGVMAHRGPDSEGFHSGEGVGLGARRLSIIDLDGGHQPISNEDDTITVVCNGEIYNFRELRRELEAAGHCFRTNTDTEVLVHLYEDYGVELLKKLRGMFAFALWDSLGRTLMLARDRLGIKPLYYAEAASGLYFGSEAKSILISGSVERALNPDALKMLFSFGFVISPMALAAGVKRLPPGHYLTFRGGAMSLRRYWDPTFPSLGDFPVMREEEWAAALRAKLLETTRKHLLSDVEIGVWLSPGLDSSSVAALMSELATRPVPAFSLSFEDRECDELRDGRVLSSFPEFNLRPEQSVFRTEDFELLPKMVWHVEDVSLAGVEISRMALARLAASRVKVVLTGEGADELFGGYRWFHGDKLLRPLARLPRWLRRAMLLGPIGPRMRPGASRLHLAPAEMNMIRYHAMVAPPHWEAMAGLISPELSSRKAIQDFQLDPPPPPEFSTWHPFCQLQYYEYRIRLQDFIIRDLDRSSMAYSLEARVPFLDHEVVEFCNTIPPNLKLRRFKEKDILRRAMADRLPEEIAQRRKRGMHAPIGGWLRGKLPDFVTEVLSEKNLRATGYFNAAVVKSLLVRHRQGHGDFARQIFGVIAVQLWHDLFVKGRGLNEV